MSTSDEILNHRACVTCRSQKVRCIPDDSNPEVCQRCARTGRSCVTVALQKRKQRKRTDTRVAELEREMRQMRAALKHKGDAATASSAPNGEHMLPMEEHKGDAVGLWYRDQQPSAPILSQTSSRERVEYDQSLEVARNGPGLWPWNFQNKPLEQNQDVIDRGMISMATARHLYEAYRKDLFPHYPLVAIPDSMTAEEMRTTRPALFLAILAAAAGRESSDLSAALDREVLQTYATRSLVQSEKSLELVQALLISAVWYHPPSKFGQLKYYEYIHMAATMAMDVGIGSRPNVRRAPVQKRDSVPARAIHPAEDVHNPDLSMTPRSRPRSPDTASIESRRTFLACYIICAGVSLSLRRPNMLRITSYIRESADVIERSPEALPSDGTLMAWVRLITIAEEIGIAFCYDDPGGVASIADLRTQLMLKDFEKRLTEWYTNVPETCVGTGSLMIMYYTIRLYCFEIALHVDHSSWDFRAPYQMGEVDPSPDADAVPTQVLADAMAELITTSHSLMDTFLAMDVESCRALPVFSYVRISFAAFVLAKLCLSAAHPRSRLGKVLDRSSLKVESYMDRAILHVRNIVGRKKSKVPSIFLALLFKLRQWCLHPDIIGSESESQPDSGVADTNGDDRRCAHFSINGPRVIESISSAESSPQADSISQSSMGNPMGLSSSLGLTATGALDPAQGSQFPKDNFLRFDSLHQTGAGDFITESVLPESMQGTAAADTSIAPPDPWSMEAMNIDENLMQMLGDMNAFSAGGLTGLDDWAAMPTDFTGMDLSGWSLPPAAN